MITASELCAQHMGQVEETMVLLDAEVKKAADKGYLSVNVRIPEGRSEVVQHRLRQLGYQVMPLPGGDEPRYRISW